MFVNLDFRRAVCSIASGMSDDAAVDENDEGGPWRAAHNSRKPTLAALFRHTVVRDAEGVICTW